MSKKPTHIYAYLAAALLAILIGCGGGSSGLVTSTAGVTALYSTAGYTETSAGYTTDVHVPKATGTNARQ